MSIRIGYVTVLIKVIFIVFSAFTEAEKQVASYLKHFGHHM